MTTEQKAKAYEEAIEKFRPIYNLAKEQGRDIDVEEFEKIFPELKESEDEKIRREIIFFLKNSDGQTIPINQYNSWIAWLEKQGEQKPAEWSEEQKARIDRIVEVLDWAEDKGRISHDTWRDYVTYVTSLKPQPQPKDWSEEDEKILKDIITDVRYNGYNNDMQANSYKKINWLKSLRLQNRWKPTKKQLIELRNVISGCSFETPVLVELEEQLKKLL